MTGSEIKAVASRRAIANLKAVCLDCANPAVLARWWAPVLGYRLRPYTDADLAELREHGIEDPEDDPAVALDPPDGVAGPTFWFNKVPEAKVAKDRVHVDVYGDWRAITASGAMVLREEGAVPGEDWVILADPEGHEFCVFPVDDALPAHDRGGGQSPGPSSG